MKVQVYSFGHLKYKVLIRHPSRAVEEALGIGSEVQRSELEGQIWELSANIWNLNESL